MKKTAKKTVFILLAAFIFQVSIVSAAFAKDTLKAGETVGRLDSLKSSDGRFTFVMQGDGNLVLYKAGRSLWSSRTDGDRERYYDYFLNRWFYDHPDELQLAANGTLEIRNHIGNVRFWQANIREWTQRHYMDGGPIGGTLAERIAELRRRLEQIPKDLIGDTLIVQNDGNVVLYDTRSGTLKPVWATNTGGH